MTNSDVAVFDLDGTVYKTECVSLRAVHAAIADAGLPDHDDEAIKSLFGYSTPEVCARLFPGQTEQVVSQLSDRVRHYERCLITQYGELYPGMRELLHSLSEDGWLLILCTNSSQVYVDTVLDGLNIRAHFSRVCMRDPILTKTDYLRQIRQRHGPSCVMIGDKPVDIDAAVANGLVSIGVLWGYGRPSDIAHATFAVDSVERLAEVLEGIRRHLPE
jgi:phosphoglycolate phosphatase